jgi:hypothetical protein
MEPSNYSDTLKRVGIVLVVVGVLDIGFMVYCIVNRVSYSSSLNIFAVIAGVFLLRGSLKAASLARWFSILLFASSVSMLTGALFIAPFDLIRVWIALRPLSAISVVGLSSFLVALLYWLVKELGSPAVLTAVAQKGVKQRNPRTAAIVGLGLGAFGGVMLWWMNGSEASRHAKALAEAEVGPSYHLFVSSLSSGMRSNGTEYRSRVTAWREGEIKTVSVECVGP